MDNEEFEAEVIENERPAGEAEVIEGERPVEEAEQALVLGDDDPRDAGLHERIISEEQAWHGKFLDVRSAQVELPNGRVTSRDLVRHPGAAAVVALTETGKIVLVRQYRTAIDRGDSRGQTRSGRGSARLRQARTARRDRVLRRPHPVPHHHRHDSRFLRRGHPYLHGDGSHLQRRESRRR